MSDVTNILGRIESGDPSAAEQLLPLVYEELRKLATLRMAQEKPGETLQATALVHEAYIRLVDVEQAQHFNSRGHFFAAAAEAMRRILVESARRKARQKRGGKLRRIDLDKADVIETSSPDELLEINEAIEKLAEVDHAAAELVKTRFFAGLSFEQAADLQGMSRTNAHRLWTYARAHLFRHLYGDGEGK